MCHYASSSSCSHNGTCTRDPNMNLIIQYGLLGLVLGLGLGLGLILYCSIWRPLALPYIHVPTASRRGLPPTFLSRTGCWRRLIARTWLITLFLQIFLRRSLSWHSTFFFAFQPPPPPSAANETKSALEGTANPIGVPQPSAAWESLRELARSTLVSIIVWDWTSQGS